MPLLDAEVIIFRINIMKMLKFLGKRKSYAVSYHKNGCYPLEERTENPSEAKQSWDDFSSKASPVISLKEVKNARKFSRKTIKNDRYLFVN